MLPACGGAGSEQLVPELVGCRNSIGITKACQSKIDRTLQLGPSCATGLLNSNADHARSFVTCRDTHDDLFYSAQPEKFRNSFA